MTIENERKILAQEVCEILKCSLLDYGYNTDQFEAFLIDRRVSAALSERCHTVYCEKTIDDKWGVVAFAHDQRVDTSIMPDERRLLSLAMTEACVDALLHREEQRHE